MSESGHIIGGPADPDYDGAVLTTALSIGDAVLHVDDTADFDEDAEMRGAKVLLGVDLDVDGEPDASTGVAVAYTSADDDTQTVTLAAASPVAGAIGDRVYIQDPVSGHAVGRLEVQVALDGADQTGDSLPAYVDVSLLESVGDVDLTDLSVDLDEDDDGQLYVSGFPGLTERQGRVRGWATDSLTVFESGDQTLRLSYRPLDQTEHLRWCGASQPYDAFTRDDYVVTIPDPDAALDAGDTLTMQYLYTDPTPRPVIPATMTLIGTGHVDAGTSSIALPAGTLEGDLIMLGIASHANTACDCSDSRMRVAHAAISPITSNNSSVWIGYGYADASGSAVPFTLAAPIGGSSARVMIATLRITGGLNVAYTALRSVDGDGGSFIPALPVGDMGVVMLLAHSGTVASDFNPEATGTWTMVGGTDSGRTVGEVTRLCTAAGDPSAGGQWAGISSGGYWTALAIGLAGV